VRWSRCPVRGGDEDLVGGFSAPTPSAVRKATGDETIQLNLTKCGGGGRGSGGGGCMSRRQSRRAEAAAAAGYRVVICFLYFSESRNGDPVARHWS
jgi:hypothetical protein